MIERNIDSMKEKINELKYDSTAITPVKNR